jgi:uncharacterized membrane protein
MNSKVLAAVWGLIAVLSAAVALYSYRYLLPHIPLLPIDVGKNLMRHPWLVVHAGLAATALMVGPFQFVTRLRASWPKVHRWMGRTYVFACIVAGFAGLPLALGTDAGPIATVGFSLLDVIWIGCTAQALRMAMTGRYTEHRRWMVRSFALTFAAVTLRLQLPIAPMLGYPFMYGYRAASWMAWIPNLMVAELYLRRGWVRRTRLVGARA